MTIKTYKDTKQNTEKGVAIKTKLEKENLHEHPFKLSTET